MRFNSKEIIKFCLHGMFVFGLTATAISLVIGVTFAYDELLSSQSKGKVLGASSIAPELPRVYVDTTLPASVGTCTVNVASGGNLQTAIDNAQLGDTICLQAGATFYGNFRLRNKTSGSGWITIRTSTPDAQLPGASTRVLPTDAPKLAKLMSLDNNPVIVTDDAAHNYWLIGLEIGTQAPATVWPASVGLIWLGSGYWDGSYQRVWANVPYNIVIDRNYIHGNPRQDIWQGIVLNSNNTAIINSYISEIHTWYSSESHGILGWNSAGVWKIDNNYLESATENILIGGNPNNLTNPDGEPADIQITRNYFYKPWTYRVTQGTTAPTGSCLYDSTYSAWGENYWLQDSSGNNLTYYACYNGAWTPISESQGNWGTNFSGKPNPWLVKNLLEFKEGKRVLVDGNVFEHTWLAAQIGAAIMFSPSASALIPPPDEDKFWDWTPIDPPWDATRPPTNLTDYTITRNLMRHIATGIQLTAFSYPHPSITSAKNILIQNNIAEDINDKYAEGTANPGLWLYMQAGGIDNVNVNHNTIFNYATPGRLYTAGLAYFNDPYEPSSFRSASNFAFSNNIFIRSDSFGSPYGGVVGTMNRFYPDGSYSVTGNINPGGSTTNQYSLSTPGNFYPADITGIGFTNYNGGNGGDYHLTSTSAYKNQATDGTDPGADITAVMTATAGTITGAVTTYTPPTPAPTPPPDIIPPTTSISFPLTGAIISGSTVVSANASDNVAVVGVQFKLDGVNLLVEDTVTPYSTSWNTTAATNGSHALTAVARDSAGNQTTSATVSVNVSNPLALPNIVPPTPTFAVGSRVRTTTNLNVRSRASSKRNSKILCTQLTGALGTIKKGPNNSWWNIDYDVRCDGWSLQAYLSLVTTTAATVTAPISRTLSVGSQGEEVTKLQTILSKLGYYKVGITGYFGTLTKAAVMKFQTANALDAVGQVGPRTRKVLQEIVW